MTAAPRIGFVGLGNMGRGMATNLATKGFAVTAFDRDETRARIVEQRGARRAASVAELVAGAEIVVTMLPDTPDVAGVHDELMRAGRSGMLHLDCSTIDPDAARRMAGQLAAKGIARVDAGTGRGPAQAERGESLFMVGASDADLARVKPLLEAMGNKVIHCGPPGSGIAMKIVNNYLAMATVQVTAEAFTLGTKLGLPTRTMFEVITSSLASNDHLKNYWPTKVLVGDVEPGFAIDLAFKDLSIGVAAAAGAGVPVPAGAAAREAFALARSGHKLGAKDVTAILVAAARSAGIEPPKL